MLGIAEPQAWVHPVALATSMRGPNSWVKIFMYAVSAQPAQAPENSRRGWLNWLPLTENLSRPVSFGAIVWA